MKRIAIYSILILSAVSCSKGMTDTVFFPKDEQYINLEDSKTISFKMEPKTKDTTYDMLVSDGFHVSAVLQSNNSSFFDNAEAIRSGSGIFKTSQAWPMDETLDFYAVYPKTISIYKGTDGARRIALSSPSEDIVATTSFTQTAYGPASSLNDPATWTDSGTNVTAIAQSPDADNAVRFTYTNPSYAAAHDCRIRTVWLTPELYEFIKPNMDYIWKFKTRASVERKNDDYYNMNLWSDRQGSLGGIPWGTVIGNAWKSFSFEFNSNDGAEDAFIYSNVEGAYNNGDWLEIKDMYLIEKHPASQGTPLSFHHILTCVSGIHAIYQGTDGATIKLKSVTVQSPSSAVYVFPTREGGVASYEDNSTLDRNTLLWSGSTVVSTVQTDIWTGDSYFIPSEDGKFAVTVVWDVTAAGGSTPEEHSSQAFFNMTPGKKHTLNILVPNAGKEQMTDVNVGVSFQNWDNCSYVESF